MSVKTTKEIQGYQQSPIVHTCSNCAFFRSKMIEVKFVIHSYMQEKHFRCGLGGFAVKKHGTCLKHVFKTTAK